MVRMKTLARKCISAAALLTLILVSVYLYEQLSAVYDTGFPAAEFQAHWNASPHCGERVSLRVHLMYQTAEIPAAFAEHVKSWDRAFPGFEIHFWTDRGISAFLQRQFGKDMLHFWNAYLAHGVERSDVARLLIVNHFGGFYADLDVMAIQTALPLVRNHSLILTEEPLPHAVFIYDRSSFISNAVLYSRPCHPFWRYYFKYYPAYLAENYGGFLWHQWRQRQRWRAVFATGPVPLDRFARQFIEEREPPLAELFVAPPVAFQPRFDAEAPSLLSLRRRCLPLLRLSLSPLQRRYCPLFRLDRTDSMLVRDSQLNVTYARHDFLHLGYHKTEAHGVRPESLATRVVLHD